MSAPVMEVGAAKALQDALLAALAADAGVQGVFGDPARVLDEVGEAPAYPYAVVERHEVRPADSAGAAGSEHTLTFAVSSKYGGRAEAMDALQTLRRAIEAFAPDLSGLKVVLALPTYADVFRTRDLKTFRGVLRARFILEAV